MNACLDTLPDLAAAMEVRSACDEIIASPAFVNAPRMCQLLAFLVEKKLADRDSEVSEYAIGLEVFGRDARSYDTTADPLVRVQMGRLRERLARYYASLDMPPAVRIVIPMGKYLPVIVRRPSAAAVPADGMLELTPLRTLGHDGIHDTFVRGLDEELKSRLFTALGSVLRLREADMVLPYRDGGPAASRRLEGSIRIEHGHVRASVRLVEAASGGIRWVSQYDCRGQLDMALQEQLAGAICTGLADHFCAPPARAAPAQPDARVSAS